MLTYQEINLLLSQPTSRYITGQRNKLIIKTFIWLGLKLGELVDLRWALSMDLRGGLMYIYSDSLEDRVLPIPSNLLNDFKKWKERQEKEWDDYDYVFSSSKGTKLLESYIQQMLDRYSDKAHIAHVYPNLLRDTCAVYLIKTGIDPIEVMNRLGLKTFSSIERWMQNYRDHIFNEYQEELSGLQEINIQKNEVDATYKELAYAEDKLHLCQALTNKEYIKQCNIGASYYVQTEFQKQRIHLCWVHSQMLKSGWYIASKEIIKGNNLFNLEKSEDYVS